MLPLFRVTLLVSCPQGAHRGQRRPCSDGGPWQRLNSVALHLVSREMRGCRARTEVKDRRVSLPLSCDRVTGV